MKDFFEKHEVAIVITISIIIGILIGLIPYKYYSNFYSEDNTIIIEVLDKEYDSFANFNPMKKMTAVEYYIIWEEGRIVITKTNIYRKKTNELYKTEYRYEQ